MGFSLIASGQVGGSRERGGSTGTAMLNQDKREGLPVGKIALAGVLFSGAIPVAIGIATRFLKSHPLHNLSSAGARLHQIEPPAENPKEDKGDSEGDNGNGKNHTGGNGSGVSDADTRSGTVIHNADGEDVFVTDG